MAKGEIAQMTNFTFFHYVFYSICILKSIKSHILLVICSFFKFGTVSKWCIREWVKVQFYSEKEVHILAMTNCCCMTMELEPKTQAVLALSVTDYQATGKVINLHLISYSFPKQALVFTCLQYKSFENTQGKGEIAHNKKFLFFPQCFLLV